VVQRDVKVGSQVGLHARPAALVAKAAAQAPVTIMIAKGDGDPVNAASLLSLLTLGAGHGDVVTLSAEGEQAEAAVEELAALIATDLDA
jgi:phosphotransferase system HPr (HPr) family protein